LNSAVVISCDFMVNRLCRALVLTAVFAATRAGAAEATTGRVFLLDGTTFTCAGEYARVGDRIVFSMPLDIESGGQSRLQLVTLPAGRVDWTRTDQYRDAVRAANYAESRGEQDFTAMTAEVARTLNDIAFASEPARRLALAEEARRRLLAWPNDHFGYRADEVREIVGLLDEAVSDLKAAAGEQSFDLSLVAMAKTEAAPLLPPPTAADLVAQALVAADLSDVPEERTGLLSGVLALLESADAAHLSETARMAARTFAERRLADERRADRAYDGLTQAFATRSRGLAQRADVRGLESLAARLDQKDASLGRLRPARVRSLMVLLNEDLAKARRLRLARDQWTIRVSTYRSYSRLVQRPIGSLYTLKPGLDDNKRLAGPDSATLTRMRDMVERVTRDLHTVVPPAELAPVHSLLRSACEMGRSAVNMRLNAIASGNMRTAWDASAAAAGALLLLEQARGELGRFLAPPAGR
jgi:hypothetical protein